VLTLAMRFSLVFLVGALLFAPAGAAARPVQTETEARAESALRATLGRHMAAAGRFAGAYVVNTTEGRVAFRRRAGQARILASNTKLFTTATALARFGIDGTLGTEVLGEGELAGDGVWRGDLYLRGGGDPAFGSRSFTRRAYGGGTGTVEELAALLEGAGIQRVTGRIVGDESRFDTRRGTAYSGFSTSTEIGGPLSALSYNRGLASEGGFSFQVNPAAFSAAKLAATLKKRGITVRRKAIAGETPAGAEVLASVDSPPMERLAALTNKPSDNLLAEMLLKAIGWQASGKGSTASGASAVRSFAAGLGAGASIVDGSGLSRGDRATPWRVVRLLRAMQARDEFEAFLASLAVAGRDGTLADRMESGPARGNCRAKTGTLSNVSALSGYCEARSGEVYVFSILMNGVYPTGARALQDRMAQAIAAMRE
jgi:D-alanyl-D-alanine carboxypeptidase/D-alanyl-D-alanine-endopeptidase (penicillin-binding protein 4)